MGGYIAPNLASLPTVPGLIFLTAGMKIKIKMFQMIILRTKFEDLSFQINEPIPVFLLF